MMNIMFIAGRIAVAILFLMGCASAIHYAFDEFKPFKDDTDFYDCIGFSFFVFVGIVCAFIAAVMFFTL